jgi:hypothetical protein
MKKNRHAKSDFTENDLPRNRFAAFWDCLKLRYVTLFRLSGLLLLFVLPLALVLFVRDYSLVELASALKAGTIEQTGFESAVVSTRANSDLLLLVAIPLFCLGFAGVFRIIKRICWEESVFFHHDFFIGIKENWLFFLGGGFFLALANALGDAMLLYGGESWLRYLPYSLALLFIFPWILFLFALSAVYTPKFFEGLRLAFLFYMKNFLLGFAVSLPFLLPSLAFLMSDLFLRYLLLGVGIVLLPFDSLAYFLFTSYVFDKDMNKRLYPAIVDKGIHRQ